jgi:hypothetical protein
LDTVGRIRMMPGLLSYRELDDALGLTELKQFGVADKFPAWHTDRMPDEDQLSLRQADQIRDDLYGIQDDLDFIKVQLARLPTRNEVWRAAMLGMIGGAVAAVTLIEAFAQTWR